MGVKHQLKKRESHHIREIGETCNHHQKLRYDLTVSVLTVLCCQLMWENLGISYTNFFHWVLFGDTETFYRLVLNINFLNIYGNSNRNPKANF